MLRQTQAACPGRFPMPALVMVAAEAKRKGFVLKLEGQSAKIGRQPEVIKIDSFFHRHQRGRRRATHARQRLTRWTLDLAAFITPVSRWTVQAINVGRDRFEEVANGLKGAVFSHITPVQQQEDQS